MGSALPAVIDYLVTGLPAPLTAIDPSVVVADNEPGLESDSLVVIGRSGPTAGDASSAQNQFGALGGLRFEEDWTLEGYIDCTRPGPSQKPARDAVFALYDGLLKFLNSDPTLGGNLLHGRFATLSGVQYRQTQDDDDTGASGALRRATVSFTVNVPNSYLP